ncbi:2-hydroxyacid dehydrogenase [Novosphingobium flavum]|uniref:2-hydroxyacid dehydrogenase n=1 Tax=Novosphingobium flavum TaxID=1778672 RepID=A0A7X1FUN8_9SPHN|nr:2-hydroxyacid dehydrogenase [Novosphingobium flavum]MBC2666737.1 2-hydroxyacid dehydrogenase [Novosphingobium flavum]
MKPNILLLEPLVAEIERELEARYTVHRAFDPASRRALPAPVAQTIRGIVTGGGTGADNDLVDTLAGLEIIAISGIGLDAVDLDRARSRGVRVTTTPDLLTDDVADLAIGLLIAAARGLCAGDRYVRDGAWLRREALPLANTVSRKKIGIFGLGRVGRAIAQRATGFGMDIGYHDLGAMADVPYTFMADLVEMARWCDFFVVASAGGAGSRGIVNAEVLQAIGPYGCLINVARGSIVDEPALVEALTSGRLGGAGLDVFADEPNVPSELIGLGSVVLQPHRASATIETRVAMGRLLIANLDAHFAGEQLLTAVL